MHVDYAIIEKTTSQKQLKKLQRGISIICCYVAPFVSPGYSVILKYADKFTLASFMSKFQTLTVFSHQI